MAFFASAIDTLKILVIALGAGSRRVGCYQSSGRLSGQPCFQKPGYETVHG